MCDVVITFEDQAIEVPVEDGSAFHCCYARKLGLRSDVDEQSAEAAVPIELRARPRSKIVVVLGLPARERCARELGTSCWRVAEHLLSCTGNHALLHRRYSVAVLRACMFARACVVDARGLHVVVRVDVHMHVRIVVRVHVHVRVRIVVRVHVHMRVCIVVRVHVHMRVRIVVRVHVHVRACIVVRMRVHARACIVVRMYVYARVRIVVCLRVRVHLRIAVCLRVRVHLSSISTFSLVVSAKCTSVSCKVSSLPARRARRLRWATCRRRRWWPLASA